MFELVSFGKSMYGGWYANFIYHGNMMGEHFDKYKDLEAWANKYGYNLRNYQYKRFDN